MTPSHLAKIVLATEKLSEVRQVLEDLRDEVQDEFFDDSETTHAETLDNLVMTLENAEQDAEELRDSLAKYLNVKL